MLGPRHSGGGTKSKPRQDLHHIKYIWTTSSICLMEHYITFTLYPHCFMLAFVRKCKKGVFALSKRVSHLRWPSLPSDCIFFSVCAHIETKTLPQSISTSKDARLVGRHTGNSFVSYRTYACDRKKEDAYHFHIDLVRNSANESYAEQATKREFNSIDSAMAQLSGIQIETTLRLRFKLKPNELPADSVVRFGETLNTERNGVQFKNTGCQFKIEGSMITEISWLTLPDGQMRGTLECTCTEFMGEKFLSNLLTSINKAKNDLFYMRKKHERPS